MPVRVTELAHCQLVNGQCRLGETQLARASAGTRRKRIERKATYKAQLYCGQSASDSLVCH